MATTYDNVYDRFLSKIADYELAELATTSITDFENTLLKYLKGAVVKFSYCKQDLSDRDDTLQQFNIGLSEMEQEILSHYMLVEWINPNVLRMENIRQSLGNRDFKVFSSANHLQRLIDLKKELEESADKLAVLYYYS